MKLLLFIFLITQTQPYFFAQSIQNDTYMRNNHPQESTKSSAKSMFSNKILILIIACIFIVVIATLLTVYFTKDQMKDFVTRVGIGQRGPVIHQFNPQVLSPEQYKQQTSSSNEQAHGRLPGYTKATLENEGQKRDQTSAHAFINSSNKHQQNAISNYRHSQSAADLFLYR